MKELLNKIHHADCLEFMKQLPDKCIDLVLTDPPYGIDFGNFNRTNKDSKGNRYKADKYKQGDWDKEFVLDEYFEEIKRISINYIIWGGNYFPCLWSLGCKGFIFWYKKNPVANFSDGELAVTSFNKPAQCIEYPYYGNIEGSTCAENKIHPTQKPKALFYLLLNKHAQKGQIILDCFSGSGTTALACHDLGLDFICIEKDADYYKASVERLEKHKAQLKLF